MRSRDAGGLYRRPAMCSPALRDVPELGARARGTARRRTRESSLLESLVLHTIRAPEFFESLDRSRSPTAYGQPFPGGRRPTDAHATLPRRGAGAHQMVRHISTRIRAARRPDPNWRRRASSALDVHVRVRRLRGPDRASPPRPARRHLHRRSTTARPGVPFAVPQPPRRFATHVT